MEISSELLKDNSPYLSQILYDALKRELVLVTVDSPESQIEKRKIVFPEVMHFSEEIIDLDDDLIDAVVGIHWINSKQVCIKTDIREIIIELTGKPFSEIIS